MRCRLSFFLICALALGKTVDIIPHRVDDSTSFAHGYGVCHSSGKTFFSGLLTAEAAFSESRTLSTSISNLFIAAYNPDGSLLFAEQPASGTFAIGRKIVCTADSIIISGSFAGAAQVGPELWNITGSEATGFYAEYWQADGAFKSGSLLGIEGPLASVALGGELLLFGASFIEWYGQYNGTGEFQTISSRGGSDPFLLALGSGGVKWTAQGGGTGEDTLNSAAVGTDMVVIVGGFQSALAVFGPPTGNITLTGSETEVTFSLSAYSVSDGAFRWAVQGGSGDSAVGNSVVLDGANSVYATGYFSGTTATFGTETLALTSGASREMFLVSYDSLGNFRWLVGATSSIDVAALGLTLYQDRVLVTGEFKSDVYFSEPPDYRTVRVVSAESETKDTFLAIYDTAGICTYATSGGSIADDAGYSVAVDSTSGSISLSGILGGSFSMEAPDLSAPFPSYARTYPPLFDGTTINASPRAMTVDPTSGKIFLVGELYGDAAMSDNVSLSILTSNLFVAGYNPDGSLIFALQAASGTFGNDVTAVVAGDKLHVSGMMTSDTGQIGDATLSKSVGLTSETFFATFEFDGTSVSPTNLIGASLTPAGLFAGPWGLLLAAKLNGTAGGPFGGVTTRGDLDTFLCLFGSGGGIDWMAQGGGALEDQISGAAVGADMVVIVGQFASSTAVFGPPTGNITLTNSGGTDLFVAAFSIWDGAFLYAVQAEGDGEDSAESVVVDSSGNAYVLGTFSSEYFAIGSEYLYKTQYSTTTESFLCSFDAGGTFNWAVHMVAYDTVYGNSLSLYQDVLVLSGFILGDDAIFFDSTRETTILSREGAKEGFIASYSASGTLSFLPRIANFVSRTGAFRWAYGAGENNGQAEHLAVDGAGRVSVGGRAFQDAAVPVGLMPPVMPGSDDGNTPDDGGTARGGVRLFPVWVDGNAQGSAVSVNKATGEAYVVGFLTRDAAFSGGSTLSVSDGNLFLAAYTSDDTLRFLLQPEGTFSEYSAVHYSLGQVAFVGSFSSPNATFGNQLLTRDFPTTNIFFAGVDPVSGEYLYAAKFDAEGHPRAVTTNSDAMFVCGFFSGRATFAGNNVTSRGESEAILMGANNTGPMWMVHGDGPGNNKANGVAASDSMVVITGEFTEDIFSGLQSEGAVDMFVAAFDVVDGRLLWRHGGGGTGYDGGSAVCMDNSGTIYVIGYVSGPSAVIGTRSLTVQGQFDTFLASYSSAAGAFNWVVQVTSSGYIAGSGIALHNDAVVITGAFSLQASFGPGQLQPYVWKTESWSTCSAACDYGVETRPVQCYSVVDKTAVEEPLCVEYGPKPEESRDCIQQLCGDFGWYALDWSDCDLECGGGSKTRAVLCWGNTVGSSVSESLCNMSKPATTAPCNAHACRTYSWPLEETSLTSVGDLEDLDVFVAAYDTSGQFGWAHSGGSTGEEGALGIAVDDAGRIAVAGKFASNFVVEDGPLSLGEISSVQIAAAWVDASTAGARGADVCVAPSSGTAFVVGFVFGDNVSLSGAVSVSESRSNLFVAGYSDGRLLFAVQPEHGTFEEAAAISCVERGGYLSFFIAGSFSSETVKFGNTTLFKSDSKAKEECFLVQFKYDTPDEPITTLGMDGHSKGIAAVEEGILLGISFRGFAGMFGVASRGSTDVLLTSVGPQGVAWIAQGGGSGLDELHDLCIAGDSVGILVEFQGTTTFGGATFSSSGDSDILTAVYSASDGAFKWAAKAGSAGEDRGTSVIMDPSGAVFVTGYFSASLSFGSSHTLVFSGESGARNMFLASYGPTGAVNWAAQISSSEDIVGSAIAMYKDILVLSGYFEETSAGNTTKNLILAAFTAGDGEMGWATSAAGASPSGVAVDDAGRITVTGEFSSEISLEAGSMSPDTWGSSSSSSAPVLPVAESAQDYLHGGAIAVDQTNGNVYVVGGLESSVTIGGTFLSSAGSNMFIAGYSGEDGSVLFATQPEGGVFFEKEDTIFVKVSLSPSGAIFLSGNFFSANATFGEITLTGVQGSPTSFFAAFKNDGTPDFAEVGLTPHGGLDLEFCNDGTEEGVFAGTFYGSSSSHNNQTLVSRGGSDLVVYRYGGSGFVWILQAGDIYDDQMTCLAVAGPNVFIGGYFSNVTRFGDVTLEQMWSTPAFVASYTLDGEFRWAAKASGVIPYDITSSGSKTFICGLLGQDLQKPSATLGEITLVGDGFYLPFVAALDDAGKFIWAKTCSRSQVEGANAITMMLFGESILVAGHFTTPMSFGEFPVASNGEEDIFLAALTTDGEWQWASSNGGKGKDYPMGIAASASGKVYLAGATDFSANPLFLPVFDTKLVVPSTLQITEGESSTISVSLPSAPLSPVTVSIEYYSGYCMSDRLPDYEAPCNEDADCGGSGKTCRKEAMIQLGSSTAIFYPWTTAASLVSVTAIADRIDEPDSISTKVLFRASSKDSKYDGLTARTLVQVADNDAVLVTLSKSQVTVEEGSDECQFYSVKIECCEPWSDVLVSVNTDSQVTAHPAVLSFTTEDWSEPQEVCLTAVDDGYVEAAILDSFVTHSANATFMVYPSSPNSSETVPFSPFSLEATVHDDDVPSLEVFPSSIAVTEGSEGGLERYVHVSLGSVPTSSVQVQLLSDSGDVDARLTVSPSSLSFSEEDWSVPQKFTLVPIDEDVANSDATGNLLLDPSQSADTDYKSLSPVSIPITVTNDDVAGLFVARTVLLIAEATFDDSYSLSLTSEPEASVTVALLSAAGATLNPDSLEFSTSNWASPQTIEVAAIDDGAPQGARSALIQHTTSSTDATYEALPVTAVNVTILETTKPSPPRLLEARFTTSGNKMTLLFDEQTNRAGQFGVFPCSKLILEDVLLGKGSQCSWSTASTISVTLGSGFSVDIGDVLTIKPGKIRARNSAEGLHSIGAVSVQRPDSPRAVPSPIILGQQSIGICDNLTLDASGSLGGSGAPLKYSWSVSSASRAVELKAYLAGLQDSNRIVIGRHLLSVGSTYKFYLQVQNFLGMMAASAPFVVSKERVPSPSVVVDGPSTLSVTRADQVRLRVLAAPPTCMVDEVGYKMTFTWSGDIDFDALEANKDVRFPDPYARRFPAKYLQASQTYTVTVGVVMDASPTVTKQVQMTVKVGALPLSCEISGGLERIVSFDNRLTLDSSRSFDPDALPGTLAYTWTCVDVESGLACTDVDGAPVALSAAAVASVVKQSLPVNKKLRFSVSVTKDTRSCTASTTITVSAGNPPQMEIASLGSRNVNPSAKITLQATAVGEIQKKVSFEWAIVDGDIERLTPDILLTSTLGPNLVFKPNSLTPGAAYAFQVTGMMAGRSNGSAVVSFTCNAPPTGQFVVEPDLGTALVTPFALRVVDVSDDDVVPGGLQYKFSVRETNGTWRPLGDRRYTNSIVLPLPVGAKDDNRTLDVSVEIFDRDGASTLLFQTLQSFLPPDDDIGDIVDDILATQLFSSGESTVALLDTTLSVLKAADTATSSGSVCNGHGHSESDTECSAMGLSTDCPEKCECDRNWYGDQCQYNSTVWERRQDLLGKILEAADGAEKIIEPSTTSVSQQAFVLHSATASPDAIPTDGQLSALALANRLSVSSDEAQAFMAVDTGQQVASSLSGLLETEIFDDDSPFVQDAVGTLSRTLDSLSAAGLVGSVAGESPVTLQTRQFVLESQRKETYLIPGAKIGVSTGTATGIAPTSFNLPSTFLEHEAADPEFIDVKTLFYGANPYAFRNQSLRANVVSFSVRSQDGPLEIKDLTDRILIEIPFTTSMPSGMVIGKMNETVLNQTCYAGPPQNLTFTCPSGEKFYHWCDLPLSGNVTSRRVNYTCPVEYADSQCLFWNAVAEEWSDFGCVIHTQTSTSLICACDHLTDFAGNWAVTTREASAVLSQVHNLNLATIRKNWVVIVTVLTVYLVIIVLCVVGHRKDRQQLLKGEASEHPMLSGLKEIATISILSDDDNDEEGNGEGVTPGADIQVFSVEEEEENGVTPGADMSSPKHSAKPSMRSIVNRKVVSQPSLKCQESFRRLVLLKQQKDEQRRKEAEKPITVDSVIGKEYAGFFQEIWISLKEEHTFVSLFFTFDPIFTRPKRLAILLLAAMSHMFVNAIFYDMNYAEEDSEMSVDFGDIFIFGFLSMVVSVPIIVAFERAFKRTGVRPAVLQEALREGWEEEWGAMTEEEQEEFQALTTWSKFERARILLWIAEYRTSQAAKCCTCDLLRCCCCSSAEAKRTRKLRHKSKQLAAVHGEEYAAQWLELLDQAEKKYAECKQQLETELAALRKTTREEVEETYKSKKGALLKLRKRIKFMLRYRYNKKFALLSEEEQHQVKRTQKLREVMSRAERTLFDLFLKDKLEAKARRLLPWWVDYIIYAGAALYALATGFYVVLFGIYHGPSVTQSWLWSLIFATGTERGFDEPIQLLFGRAVLPRFVRWLLRNISTIGVLGAMAAGNRKSSGDEKEEGEDVVPAVVVDRSDGRNDANEEETPCVPVPFEDEEEEPPSVPVPFEDEEEEEEEPPSLPVPFDDDAPSGKPKSAWG